MKILFFQWNAFMQKEIEEQLNNSDIEFDRYYYVFKDWERDDRFCSDLEKKLKDNNYDAVFSVNFSPLISNVCELVGIKYISWIYDCPLHIRDDSALANSCNVIFFFDGMQVNFYKQKFPESKAVFEHLPLAAKPQLITVEDYAYDIALLGKLYKSDFNYLCGPLDNYHRGYLDGIVSTQIQLGSGYILDELLTKGLLDSLNVFYSKASLQSGAKEFNVKKEELEFTLATEVTGRQRFMALALLQSRLKTALYSNDRDDRLNNVEYKGYVDYYSQMPRAFAYSKLNLNISLCSIKSGIPLRVLDICKTGAAVVTNAQPELFEYFVPDESIIIYEDIKDLVEKSLYYAKHDSERQLIAKRGYEIVCEAFSYSDRVNKIFSEFK